MPETALLYASWRHAPGVPTLQQYCMETYAPSVLLVRSGDYVFGGYATDAWNADGVRFGSPKCFLFSVTHDRKIPFHGRTRDAKSQTRAQRSDATDRVETQRCARRAYLEKQMALDNSAQKTLDLERPHSANTDVTSPLFSTERNPYWNFFSD